MVAKTQAKECLMHHHGGGKIYVRPAGETLRKACMLSNTDKLHCVGQTDGAQRSATDQVIVKQG